MESLLGKVVLAMHKFYRVLIKTKKVIPFILASIFLFAVWHMLSVIINKNVLPPPMVAIQDLIKFMNKGLIDHFLISAYRVVVSLFLAFIVAVPIGFWMGRNRSVDKFLAPLIYITYPIPKSVFLPIFVVLFGLGDAPKIILITLIVFFQILVTARDASKNVADATILSMRSLSASEWQIYRHVIWPACLPEIMTSLRISLGTAIAVLFLAETFASTTGLGYFIMDAMGRYAHSRMFAGIMAMGFLGLVMYLIVDIIDSKLCSWKK